MYLRSFWVFFSVLIILVRCDSVPKVPTLKVGQYSISKTLSQTDSTLTFTVNNTLESPLTIAITTSNKELQALLNPFTLQAIRDTTLTVAFRTTDTDLNIRMASYLGDPNKIIRDTIIQYPIPRNTATKIIQGNESTPTHNTDWSRYAVDFDIKVKDTIYAADSGYVVGVVQAYTDGGPSPKWRDFSNFITTYNKQSGIFTQYVHLYHNGSFVKIGDYIRPGDAIGIVGYTGQTNIEHLHFNRLKPKTSGLGITSIPIHFTDNVPSTSLKRGQTVTRQ